MEFPTKTDEELDREGLLPYGIYAAEIIEVEERIDKNKNPFLVVKLGVYDDTREVHVWDNVSAYWMHFKWKHLFKSAEKMDVYEKAYIEPADMLHWQVAVLIDQEGSKDYRDKNSGERKTSPPKNVVKDYLTRDNIPGKAVREAVAKSAADPDLPFSIAPILPFLVAFLGIGASLLA